MRSPRHGAGRLVRHARGRLLAPGREHGAVVVPPRFRPLSHSYAGYAGPWIEEAFSAFWRARRPTGIERTYVPVFWTDYYLRHGRRHAHAELQEFLDSALPRDDSYFTIVQHDDGILERLPPDVLVFGAGNGAVPIPLHGRRPRARERVRDVFCSFMGSVSGPHDRFGVRSALARALSGEPGFHVGHGSYEEFVDVTSRSTFVLAPRGYGPSSYRLYEAMALGAVPVYVWAELEWLPWRDELDWDELCVRVNVADVERIPELLRALPSARVDEMRRAAAAVFDDYFSLGGTCRRIVERLVA